MTVDRTQDHVRTMLAPHDPLVLVRCDRDQLAPTPTESAALTRARAALDHAITRGPTVHPRPIPVQRARRPRWAVLAVPAAVLTAAVVATVPFVDSGSSPEATTAPPTIGQAIAAVAVSPGDPVAAPAFLGQAAMTIAAATAPVPGPNQFVYVRSVTASIDLTPAYEGTGPAVDEGVVDREVWLPQDPDGGTGLIREDGQDTVLNPEFGGGASPSRYAALSALPTDPGLLLTELTVTAVGADVDPSLAAFTTIRDLLAESLAPPATTAALYRAAALIPGIELVPHAVDAAGRTGSSIALVRDGQRTEMVFDATTGIYLGGRSYFQTDSRWGPAGTLTSLTAVLARGISDTVGTVPTGADLLD